jgi:hypothetical protein
MNIFVGITQISWLREQMIRDEHFDIYDFNTEDFYRIWEIKTKKQYGYFLFLWGNHDYFKAKKLLDSFGFKYHSFLFKYKKDN